MVSPYIGLQGVYKPPYGILPPEEQEALSDLVLQQEPILNKDQRERVVHLGTALLQAYVKNQALPNFTIVNLDEKENLNHLMGDGQEQLLYSTRSKSGKVLIRPDIYAIKTELPASAAEITCLAMLLYEINVHRMRNHTSIITGIVSLPSTFAHAVAQNVVAWAGQKQNKNRRVPTLADNLTHTNIISLLREAGHKEHVVLQLDRDATINS